MQVVKVRVESVDTARKRLTLGLVARKAAGGEDGEEAARDELGGLQPGDLVRGTVEMQKKQVSRGPFVAISLRIFRHVPSSDTEIAHHGADNCLGYAARRRGGR